MKLILLLLWLIPLASWSAEIKLTLDKGSVFTGEIVSAQVENYQGLELVEKKVDDTLYLIKLNQTSAEVVFLKKPSANRVALSENDDLTWNPIEITEIKVPENILLNELSFNLKEQSWIYLAAILLLLIACVMTWYWKKIKPQQLLKKELRLKKEELFKATNYQEITLLWKNKHRYLDAFPFIEEEFNKFEAKYYKYAFKPSLSEDERKEVVQAFRDFLDQVRGGKYGV